MLIKKELCTPENLRLRMNLNFLFGPRGVGKSSLMVDLHPKALYLDLLEAFCVIRKKEFQAIEVKRSSCLSDGDLDFLQLRLISEASSFVGQGKLLL